MEIERLIELANYIRLNDKNEVIKCFSDEVEQPLTTDIEVFTFNTTILDNHGIFLFKYLDGEVIMKTPEEQESEFKNLPKPSSEVDELRKQLESMSSDFQEFMDFYFNQ